MYTGTHKFFSLTGLPTPSTEEMKELKASLFTHTKLSLQALAISTTFQYLFHLQLHFPGKLIHPLAATSQHAETWIHTRRTQCPNMSNRETVLTPPPSQQSRPAPALRSLTCSFSRAVCRIPTGQNIQLCPTTYHQLHRSKKAFPSLGLILVLMRTAEPVCLGSFSFPPQTLPTQLFPVGVQQS